MNWLIPDFGCNNRSFVYAESDCANAVTNAWHYSFRSNDCIDTQFFSDLRLDKENVVSDGFFWHGILVYLGNVDLENLTTESDGIKYLSQFVPAARHSDAMKQLEEIVTGIDSSGYNYSNKARFELNSTHALRSIAYNSNRKPKVKRKDDKMFSFDDKRFASLKADKTIDIIIVFQVIRVEENGGITIVWKEISRQKAPMLVIAKNERLADIR